MQKKKPPEPVNVENEEKRSIYLAESSWDEDNSEAAIAGEVPSKELEKEQKIRDITTTRPPISFICLPEPWQDSDVYR